MMCYFICMICEASLNKNDVLFYLYDLLPNKSRYGSAGLSIRYFRVNFFPNNRFWEVSFAQALGFGNF